MPTHSKQSLPLQIFRLNFVYKFITSPKRAAGFAHPILLDLIIIIMSTKKYGDAIYNRSNDAHKYQACNTYISIRSTEL
jgi:hypothetical protein